MNLLEFKYHREPEPEAWRFRSRDDDSIAFSEYFYYGGTTDELAEKLGIELRYEELNLPQADLADEQARIEALQIRLKNTVAMVNLESEASRREFQIAPVLYEACDLTGARVYPEYSVNISQRLHGVIDFLIQCQREFVVIEAKRDDRIRGFKQLLAEMLAISDTGRIDGNFLGAVTYGDVWQFAKMDAQTKQCWLDNRLFCIPDQVGEVLAVIVAALRADGAVT